MKEQDLVMCLKAGNKEAFTQIFTTYYRNLVLFGGHFLPDQSRCEDIVQTVFLKLWSDRELLEIDTSLKSYLLKSVRNGCLDEIKHLQVMRQHEEYTLSNDVLEDVDTTNYILYSDLSTHLNQALQKIPEKYRIAFMMNRFDGLRYKEIAEKLDISERMVDFRISKALELLRIYLKDFMLLFLFIT